MNIVWIGITTFSPLKRWIPKKDDAVVGVIGLGGLGELAEFTKSYALPPLKFDSLSARSFAPLFTKIFRSFGGPSDCKCCGVLHDITLPCTRALFIDYKCKNT